MITGVLKDYLIHNIFKVNKKLLAECLLALLVLGCFVGLVKFPMVEAQGQKSYLKSFESADTYLKIPTFSFSDSSVSAASKSDSYQFNITLNKPIVGNVLSIPLETYGLEFYYQPPLTEELNSKDYDLLNATHAIRKGQVVEYRPLNVVGSYAVYKSNVKGGETGKLYHIYAPLLIDAKGVTSWAKLNVTKNSFSIIIDEVFLESAVYPLIVDPTFGYTSAGASGSVALDNNIQGYHDAPASDGTVDSITIYIGTCTSKKVKCALYAYAGAGDAGALIASTEERTLTKASAGWETFTFSSPPSVTSGTQYFLLAWAETGGPTIYYDSGGATGVGCYKSVAYGDWPNPLTGETSSSAKRSLYATYTTSSSAENVSLVLNTPANASTINTFACDFNYTPAIVGFDSFQNASLFIDGSSVANNASALVNATLNTIAYTFTENGTYLWDVRVFNSTTGVFSSNGNFTLTVSVVVPDTYIIDVEILNPENVTYTTNIIPVNLTTTTNGTNPVTTFNIQFANASWLYGSNQTFSGYTTATINENLTAVFFCWAVNDEGSTDNANVTFTVNVVLTYPVAVSITSPSNSTYTVNHVTLTISVATNGTASLTWYRVYNGSDIIIDNTTYVGSTSLTGFVNGTSYKVEAFANNTEGYSDSDIKMFSIELTDVPSDDLGEVALGLVVAFAIPALVLSVYAINKRRENSE